MKICANDRLDAAAPVAERSVVGRHVAPAEHDLALLADDAPRSAPISVGALRGVVRQEDQAGAVARPSAGSVMPSGAVTLRRNRSGHLDQDAGAVAGVDLAAAGAAVLEVVQHLSACATIACDCCPLMWTTKPTPQASCSCCGS